MTARRRMGSAILAVIALVALAACTTIPNSGPVNEGAGVVSSSEPFEPIAEGPRIGDAPTAVVSGFVAASSLGFQSDFTVARQFLTLEAAATWDPNEKVTVFDSGALTAKFDDETDIVTYDIPVLATIDDSGRLTEAADGTRETLTFQMEQDADGNWRISDLENGTILAGANLPRLFTQVSLVFASVDETTQVPEMRWLPRNEDKLPTLAARELVEGPSDWLAPAVHTGFPPTSALAVDSVVVTDGVAAVQLTADSAGDVAERSLAQEQMQLTLAGIPGITGVKVTVGGVAIGGDDSADLKAAPLPSTDTAAFVNGRLGVWDGQDLWQVPDSVGALPDESHGVAQSFDKPTAAWIVNGSTMVSTDAIAGGTSTLEKYSAKAATPTQKMPTTTLYQGQDLIAPSADRHGWFWTTSGNDPTAFIAVSTDGTVAKIPIGWLRGTTVQALAVSRDGARIAVLSRSGGKQLLEVASIVRGADGAPLTIGEPLAVGADLGPSIDLTWVDDLTLAALGDGSGEVPNGLWLVDVGGLTTAQKSVTGAVGITAREQERSLIVVDNQNQVFARSGTVWSKVATGPSELAYSG